MKCNLTCGVLFLVLLSGCTTANTEQLETKEQENIYNGSGIVYQYEPIEHTNSPQPYQVIVDEDFELFSDHEHATGDNMKFLYKPDLENYRFEIGSGSGELNKEVATLSFIGFNAIENGLMSSTEFYDLKNERSEKEQEEIEQNIREEVEEDQEYGLEDFKEGFLLAAASEPVIITHEEEDLGIFTFMVESITEEGYHLFRLIGRSEDDYISANMTIPEGQKDLLFDQMLESIQSVTNNRDRFFDEFTDVKIPSIYTYEPPKHHDEYYPEIGYSFHAPKTDHFFLNDRYGSYYGYRFTFYGRYDTEIKMPIPKLEIRSARIEDESFSENQINNQEPDGYMGYEDKFAYAVSDLMLDDTVDTGIFTTAKKVLFDGYNVYWFVTEVDGFIYSINFNIAEDAPEEILDTFLNDVVATFELKEG